MYGGATCNDFAFDPARGQHQIKGLLDTGFRRPHRFFDTVDEVRTLAHGALGSDNHEVLGRFQGPIWTLLFACPALPERFAGADIDPFPLVVEVSAIIDVLVVGVHERDLAPGMEVRELLTQSSSFFRLTSPARSS